ncbi:MAG: hypothetical protein K0Q76_2300 [Panacagrimonas sp.]|jgi:hypothetical protein|nr:DUF4197 domain-containing protein [Panacagrimonas sp.]MCC2657192.1 hypothetical protein [Panacagrimonas sp.]
MPNQSLMAGAVGLMVACGAAAAETDWKGMAQQAMEQMAQSPQASQLADAEIVQGLREALAKGTRSAVLELGKADGFWASDRFRIPLPKTITKADTLLRAGGYGPQIDELHLSFNRAAEQSVPIAADVFAQAVQKLTIADARNILSGAPDAATEYFRKATGETLALQFKPLVAKVTAGSGLVQQYDRMIASAGPLAAALAGQKADVNDYVTRKALNRLFLRVADEEKAIRSNPAARTSEILKKVFGNK